MNKLALFTLAVICGAAIAADCTTYNTGTDCTSTNGCTFTPTTTTCKNSCVALTDAQCVNADNKTNCLFTQAFCSVSTVCALDTAAQKDCEANTACKFTPSADTVCANNGTILADACTKNNANIGTCETTTPTYGKQCTYTPGSFKQCDYIPNQCVKITDPTKCVAGSGCALNADNVTCDDVATACSTFTTAATCNVSYCTATLNTGTCTAVAGYCTDAKLDAKCNTTNNPTNFCNITTPQVNQSCKNTNAATCKAAAAQADCTGVANNVCKWNNYTCLNTVDAGCIETNTQTECTAKGKFCNFVQNGTCATKTTNSMILAVAGSLIALIAML